MKKFLLLTCVIFLNSCAQNTSLLGPGYTLVKSGSIVEAGASLSTSYGLNKISTDSLTAFDENIRECRTEHSSELSKIFFETLDELNCYKDPFSILR